MQLFDDKTTKRHARLVGLGAILAATQVFQIKIKSIPILDLEGFDANVATIMLSLLVIVWFVTWAQLYYFDEMLNTIKTVFTQKRLFSAIYFEKDEAFKDLDAALTDNFLMAYNYFLMAKTRERSSIKHIDGNIADLAKEFAAKCATEYKRKKFIFHLTKIAHYGAAWLALMVAAASLIGWQELNLYTYSTETLPQVQPQQ